MKYKIIDELSINDLVSAVNASLANGWQPKGGMVSYRKADCEDVCFAQTLVISDAKFEAEAEREKNFRYG